jgi:hypothetical protein
MKNKTLATWLAFVGGPLGLHRFYLKGGRDWLGWALLIPSALGVYGVFRVREYGVDDRWSWLLLPPFGLTIAGCALTAIIYGLMTPQKWNGKFNHSESAEAVAGNTNWLTIAAVVFSLLVGTAALMSAIAFSFQHYFELQA